MLTIRNKLYLGFTLILAFLLGQTAFTYRLIDQSEHLVHQALDKDFSASIEIASIGIEAHKLRSFEKEFLIYTGVPSQRGKYTSEWREAHDQIKIMLNRIVENRDTTWSSDDITKARDWLAALNTYEQGFSQVVQQVHSGRISSTMQSNEAMREAKDAFRALLDGTTQGGNLKFEQATKSGQAILGKFRNVNFVLITSALLGTCLVVTLLIIIPAMISRPIEALTRSAHEMSTGDMNKPIAITGSIEFTDLAETLERMRISQQMLLDRLINKRNSQA